MTTSLFRESKGEEELPASCGPAHALKGRRCVSPRVNRNTAAASGEGIALGDEDITLLGGEGIALLDPLFSAESSALQVDLDQVRSTPPPPSLSMPRSCIHVLEICEADIAHSFPALLPPASMLPADWSPPSRRPPPTRRPQLFRPPQQSHPPF